MIDESPVPQGHTFPWRWCREAALAPTIARFFAAQAGPTYISHAELQFGRASAPGRWSDDLLARIEAEALDALTESAGGTLTGLRCALARSPEGITGLAFVRFVAEAPQPFVVLEDLLIDVNRRGEGLGRRCLDWLSDECRHAGFSRLFLESGVANHGAHHFFERHGFAQTSVVMMRDLCAS